MSATGEVGRGEVIAIGGAEDQVRAQEILGRIVDGAGGADARIVVIPTASRRADAGVHYCRLFRDLGAGEVTSLALERRIDCALPRVLEHLRRATGIFITGGNQLRLAAVIGGTEAAYAIRERNAAGAVVAGTSAGAAYLSEHMIAYGREGGTPRAGMVSVVPGLGLLRNVIVDQHFRQRDRLGRLLTAIAYNPFAIGLGIDEDTAAAVGGDGTARILGRGAVTVVDGTGLTHDAMGLVRAGEPVSLVGLTVHVLVDGGEFDLVAREAYVAEETARDVTEERLRAADRDVLGLHGSPPRHRGGRRRRRSNGSEHAHPGAHERGGPTGRDGPNAREPDSPSARERERERGGRVERAHGGRGERERGPALGGPDAREGEGLPQGEESRRRRRRAERQVTGSATDELNAARGRARREGR